MLKRIASCLTEKWKQTYSRTCRYINSRVTTKMVQKTHGCIKGLQLPVSNIIIQIPHWDNGSTLKLYR